MAENKFIQRLKGQDTTGALLEIKKENSKTVFAKMPQGTSDATVAYSDSNNDAIAVLKNAINWKVIGRYLDLSTSVSGDGDDYTGEAPVSGISDAQGNNLWINSSYTVPEGGMIFTKNTKWVLKLCGDNLIENGGDSIGFTVVITLGNSNIISKTFTVREQASFFCKEMIIDFSESNDSVIKLEQSDKITLKLLSNSANASARIYQGMTTLTALQRRVDSDVISSDSKTFADIEGDIEDIQEHIIVKSATMPTASADLVGSVYQYVGATASPYEHGFIYECVQSSPGVYNWQRMDVQPGGSRGRFLSLWDCATGLAVTNPPISPYEYKAGDYFIVSNVSASTNYKPDGTQYVIGTASTAVETSAVFVDDTYFFDGTTWKLQNTSNDIKTLLDGKVSTDGSSIMTGVLKMRASISFKCAIAPYWDGVGFYKLNDNDSVTLMASMEDTTGFIPAGTATYDIGSSDHKWKDLYVARVVTGVLNNGANINVPTTAGTLGLNDFSNITDSAKNISTWSTNMTNCITEIPQDIKLELASGTLTLAAGSVLTRPDGTQATTTEDKTYTASGSSTYQGLVFVEKTSGAIQTVANLSKISSGTTLPVSPNNNDVFYKTDTNEIYMYYNSQWNAWSVAMPIALCTVTSGVITSIDQTFNGFGWLGTKVFILPGVKALAPNGRNADGSLKNTVVTVSELKTSDSYNSVYILNNAGVSPASFTNYAEQETRPSFTNGIWYQPSTNTMYNISNGTLTLIPSLYAFKVFAGSGISAPTSMKIKQAFRAVDYSDTEFISNQAMPSGRTINLTLGTSGSTYAAPADGYFTITKGAGASGEWLYLRCASGLNIGIYPPTGMNGRACLPVSKGDIVTVSYTLTGATSEFKFVYANGAK